MVNEIKKVLVSGGAGFIGSHVVELLEAGDRDVLVVDDFSSGKHENLNGRVRVIEANLCDPCIVDRVLTEFRPEGVIHLAAQVNVRRSIEDPASDAAVNVLGGVHLLKACTEYGVRRFIFASSGGAIYGEHSDLPIPETAVPDPRSPYGLSKMTLEHYGRYFSVATGLEFVALRLANVYGPRQDAKGEAGVVAIFMDRLLRGIPPTIFGDGMQTRDYVWVGDVASAFAVALSCPPGTYNIGTGIETRTLDVYNHLRNLIGTDYCPRMAPGMRGEVNRNCLEIGLARRVLNWSPTVDFREGLAKLISLNKREIMAGK